MIRLVLPVAVLAAVAACDQPRMMTGDPSVRVASAYEVQGCTPIKTYTTTTGVYGAIGRKEALELARNETIGLAGEAGANTIVFEAGGPADPDALFVKGTGYRC